MTTLGFIGFSFYLILFLYIAYKFIRSVRIVQSQQVYIVERLGKYKKTLGAGFHILIPFFDRVAYMLTLKEEAIDVPAQVCITKDNVQVRVDGIIYLKVFEPEKAVYNVTDYRYAVIQLAQTTMRSILGHMELDKTFEERDAINGKIVQIVDEASEYWGVDILRYEIQNISPSKEILNAMEKQMTAERDKRAVIAISEGDMTSQINQSEGIKQEMINVSEGEKMKLINEAEGRASEIRAVADATASGIRKIAASLNQPGGAAAVKLSLSEDYLKKINGLAKKDTNLILPVNLGDPEELLEGLYRVIEK
ncbi:MAG: paraslipin [Spirochaetia bacterium]|nr:paraslipin [Spirochaetia bacterium]